MSTREQALEFITLHATQSDLDRVYAAAKQRTQTLRDLRAAAVSEGTEVRLSKIKPKYLNGLTGTVKTVEQKRTRAIVSILLDEESTENMRHILYVERGVKRHLLTGVPASVCEVLAPKDGPD
ncbi:hypothetical protein SLUN_00075 [Streptomyces lunaelactis]|uniref:Uncharacterized protein n=1 Tax=Streptomyces lunaelactis TaxID=1535768 RepID=A0A2R4SVL0_9ACTN|nr:hypothetical protein [Streptomyces lunaelactis]AVZ70901.1 hypothetical protein SLUN_00075 [Streptomyces lunaelactis]NUK26911.1 hypothetical protein [Streptomyces lunaelactis]NUK85632.1 hypothetical protein [Streptomyces lunaelactis]